MKITYRALKRAGACSEQLEEFKQRFGSSVDVTEEACVAVSSAFDWDWAAGNLLKSSARKVFEDAREIAAVAYEDARAIARTVAVTWKEYEDARAIAEKVYDDTMALAFARAYNSQNLLNDLGARSIKFLRIR